MEMTEDQKRFEGILVNDLDLPKVLRDPCDLISAINGEPIGDDLTANIQWGDSLPIQWIRQLPSGGQVVLLQSKRFTVKNPTDEVKPVEWTRKP